MDLRISHIEKWNSAPSLITTLSMLANNKIKSFLFHSLNYTLSTQENNYRRVLTSIESHFSKLTISYTFWEKVRSRGNIWYSGQIRYSTVICSSPFKSWFLWLSRFHLHKIMLHLLVNRGQILKASQVQVANWSMPKPANSLSCVARVNHGTS